MSHESLAIQRGGGGGRRRIEDSWSESLCVGCWMEDLVKVAGGKDKLLSAARFLLAAWP